MLLVIYYVKIILSHGRAGGKGGFCFFGFFWGGKGVIINDPVKVSKMLGMPLGVAECF